MTIRPAQFARHPFARLTSVTTALACATAASAAPISIRIDPNQRYQQMEGFGASLTESSATLINSSMSPTQRTALMQTLFSPTSGVGLSFLRQPIGSSDFALSNYSYNDIPTGQADYGLAQFSIARDQQTIIPLLQQAKALNPSLRLMGTPWSPPAWMKTTGQVHGGSLKNSASIYETYANYFVKYAQAYQAAGLPIDYVSMQNEPWYETLSYPSMRMEPAEQARLIKLVGPKFAAAGIDTKILGWDHNWGEAGQFVPQLMADAQAAQYIDGIAFHGYSGNVSAQSTIRNLYPDKGVFFTEVTSTLANTNFAGDLMWDMQNLIVGGPRNWSKSVVRWNLALDQNGNPKQSGAPAGMRGLVTVNSNTGQVTLNGEYYSMAHLSKFVVPGAYRVASDDTKSVAFVNPDGSDAVVAYNDAAAAKDIVLRWKGRMMPYRLPAQSVATFAWDGITGTGVQVWLTTGDRSKLLARQADTTFATTTWTANKIANWHDDANWSIAAPYGVDDRAMLGGSITAARTIYADDSVTLGTLRFNNANSYIIAGSATLTMQVSDGSALIEARTGTQKINLPLTIASNTMLSVLSGATLVIADPMTINSGVTLMQTGGGTISYLSTVHVPAAASVAFGGDANVAGLSLARGSAARAADVGRSFVRIDQLSIANGAQFDLSGSVLALTNTSAINLRAMLDANRIISHDVSDAGGRATIVTLDALALAGAGATIDPRFLSFASGSVAVPAILGDVDLDGTVTKHDLQVVIDHLGDRPALNAAWLHGDINLDGVVDGVDRQITLGNLGMTVVPEPTAAIAGLLAGLFLMPVRRVAKRRTIVGLRHVTPLECN